MYSAMGMEIYKELQNKSGPIPLAAALHGYCAPLLSWEENRSNLKGNTDATVLTKCK